MVTSIIYAEQARSPATVFTAYGGRAEPLLPPEIQQRLRADQALLQRRACDMTVDVEPGLAQFGWEGLVVAALKDVKQPREAPLRLRLVILQAPALGQTDARSEADYEEAALLRELAAVLFLKGVPCIVTIPPLPAEVAPAALAGLTAALIRLHKAGGLDAERLSEAMLAAVRQARQDVAAAFGQNAAAGFEAAWDLCLYAGGH